MRKHLPYLMGVTIVVAALMIATLLPAGSPYRVVLRAGGCEAARQLGLKPVNLVHGCELSGIFTMRSLSWVSIDGIEIARSEVIALEEIK